MAVHTPTEQAYLKPCPFCGGEPVLIRDYPPSKNPAMDDEWVECKGCHAMGPAWRIRRNHSQAVVEWNRRVVDIPEEIVDTEVDE